MTLRQGSPDAKTSSAPDKPVSQGRPYRLRSKFPVWVQELPTLRFPPRPDPNFQLLDNETLEKVLAETDEATAKRIREDKAFLDEVLLSRFLERDFEAKRQQNRYRQYQLGYIFLAALASMIGSIQAIALIRSPDALPFWGFMETVIALVVTYLATISGREPPMPIWLDNRRKAEQLRREYFRYLLNLLPYETKDGYERQTELKNRVADIYRGDYPEEPLSVQ